MTSSFTPSIALTPGEPAGIGPDITIRIAQKKQKANFLVFADPDLLQQRAQQLKLPLKLHLYEPSNSQVIHTAGELTVVPITLNYSVEAGIGNKQNAPYVLNSLSSAITFCQKNICHALVTGPVHKGLINQAGFSFSGHTEFLQEKTQSSRVVMVLASKKMRIALATTHLPLSKVPNAITSSLLENIIAILHEDLQKKLSIKNPKILVCGLNPHAGDLGALGKEEIEIIQPVIKKMQDRNVNIEGPFSADTIFSDTNLKNTDVFLAMYHDQGLPVLKYSSFGEAINITLGLNIIRTSVDHGTAFELAGTNNASCNSLQLAIDTAIEMITNQKIPENG